MAGTSERGIDARPLGYAFRLDVLVTSTLSPSESTSRTVPAIRTPPFNRSQTRLPVMTGAISFQWRPSLVSAVARAVKRHVDTTSASMTSPLNFGSIVSPPPYNTTNNDDTTASVRPLQIVWRRKRAKAH